MKDPMAGSNGIKTEVDMKNSKTESLPFIAVSNFQARFLSGVVTFIFTAYLTVGLLVLLKWLARILSSPRF
ncbi:MAG: hypothetical protein HY211_08375 [Candidatus Omnitrophica bacterium]|nr:hypothetical protein [Candidatus Omnitrophota bacterium]